MTIIQGNHGSSWERQFRVHDLRWHNTDMAERTGDGIRRFGIEVEVCAEYNRPDLGLGWDRKSDSSLPECGVEYASRPYKLDKVGQAAEDYEAILQGSHSDTQAGIHIHIGSPMLAGFYTTPGGVPRDLMVAAAASYVWHDRQYGDLLWDALAYHTGRSTLRAARTEHASPRWDALSRGRYQDVNLTALSQHGTVEYRLLPTGISTEGLCAVVDYLWRTTEAIERTVMGIDPGRRPSLPDDLGYNPVALRPCDLDCAERAGDYGDECDNCGEPDEYCTCDRCPDCGDVDCRCV